ncbi:MAG: hypothetical protein KF849_11115 [Rhizobiaceae bacterium]|nr:hypothetical protein [Rhizobiaceae bacterium]
MLAHLPLMIVPFVLYNLGLVGLFGGEGNPWGDVLFSLPMLSGGTWSMTLADLMVVIALALLFIEVLKSTRTSNVSVVDHMLSLAVLVLFIVEFLLVQGAASSLFFVLGFIALIDVLAGFSVSLRAAGRDISIR